MKKTYPKKKTNFVKTVPDIKDIHAKYLIIVESPSKCNKIENFLGSQYYCIASKGHIRTIDGLKSIDTKSFSFEPKFSIIEDKKSHIEYMKSVIAIFSKENIILATDDDREGEAIAWHICELFDLPISTTKRILFHEITKQAICEAVKSPTVLNMNLVKAQHARQVLDVLVGYKISPFLWKYFYHDKSNSLSAGRCQTPALRLVYDNEKENKNSIETKYTTIGSFFSNHWRTSFELTHFFDTSEEVLQFLEKTKTFEHKICIGNAKETKISPPKPFNTSRLLQVASNVLHISPKETMNLCQKLYQNGYITYMRTESQKYSNDFLKKAETFILQQWKSKDYMGNIDVLENKDVNNPHEAIRVTHLETTTISCDENESSKMVSLYRIIWCNSIESCMSEARYNQIHVKISAPMEKKYCHTIEIPLFLGWKEKEKTITEEQKDPSSLLFYFQSIEKSGKPIPYNSIESLVTIKHRHQHYTESSLISKLEDLGIGRPSTFAMIVDTIQERGYVKKKEVEGEKKVCKEFKLYWDLNDSKKQVLEQMEKEKVFGNEKNKLILQPMGELTIEFLIQHFQELFSYDYTKKMELELDDISSGINQDWSSICKECYDEIKELSKPVAKIEKQVYPIDEEHVFVFEKYGPVVRKINEDGVFEYKPIKKDVHLDLEKLKQGGYTVEELCEIKENCLGKYENENLFLKNGRFGPYVQWGEKTESIKKLEKPFHSITIDDIVDFLGSSKKEAPSLDKNLLRRFTPELSIRKGKFGPYAFYQTKSMKKPAFYNIQKFPEGFGLCDPHVFIEWLENTYHICIERTKKEH